MKLNQPIAEAVGICVAISLILWIYAWSENPLSWGNFVLTQAGYKRFMTHNPVPKAINNAENHDSIPLTPKNEIAIDTSAQRVLLVGDSMVQELEMAFGPICAGNHFDFQSIAIQSSSILYFANTDTLRKAIASFNPTLVIVVLGSNELTIPDVEVRRPQVEKIINVIGDRKLIWVGPPNWRKDTGMNDFLEEIVANDRFFKSADLKFERKPDGIHPTSASSFIWADSISAWIQKRSRYRIRFDRTHDDSLAKVILKRSHYQIYQGRLKQQRQKRDENTADSLNKLIQQQSIPDLLDTLFRNHN